jgi:hypothetical protein
VRTPHTIRYARGLRSRSGTVGGLRKRLSHPGLLFRRQPEPALAAEKEYAESIVEMLRATRVGPAPRGTFVALRRSGV